VTELAWRPDVLGVQRLVVDGRATRYYATTGDPVDPAWCLWDSRPDPDAPGPPAGRFLKAFRSREALEAWIRRRLTAGGLTVPPPAADD
jgi:hypothetical protein